jgi:hypothetical protein
MSARNFLRSFRAVFEIKGEIKGAVLELFFSGLHCRSISETAAFARKPERLK